MYYCIIRGTPQDTVRTWSKLFIMDVSNVFPLTFTDGFEKVLHMRQRSPN